MTNYNSGSIKVFPTIRRNDIEDRKSRLITEENIIKISNNLSGGQSYILNGLTINKEGTQISSGACIINGYYFKIENNINLEPTQQDNFLYFQIKTQMETNFTELISFISNTNKKLDYENNFTGLNITFNNDLLNESEIINLENKTPETIYNLLIAKKVQIGIDSNNKPIWQ